MPRIARNIAARNLNLVALQETMNTNGGGVAARLTSLTHHTWKVAPTVKKVLTDIREGRRKDSKGWMFRV